MDEQFEDLSERMIELEEDDPDNVWVKREPSEEPDIKPTVTVEAEG